jgi:hypothetical protein
MVYHLYNLIDFTKKKELPRLPGAALWSIRSIIRIL